MKSILTIVFIITLGVFAQAQNTSTEVEANTIEMSVVVVADVEEAIITENTMEVARLYRRSNSQVKKALAFTTKRNRAKMA
ncbi:hypothetical protein FGM00_11715 [Aggregatimonas sangjinii]|uniref:Uncharacterized protein n=1 Tax=Aggregatimonas sangjinii TaxID=2583587 RepID=A0A5B7SUZ5_9FLAO|nr:hypothetical protein [Aggregatimonas sangjinii]QCX00741.1 hypothetical protein FGM00_11715 [Aggregatimonas sangjinii]